MLSIDLIRRDPEQVRRRLARRGGENAPVSEILDLDSRRRMLVTERDTLRSQHKDLSRQFGKLRQEKSDGGANSLIEEIRQVSERISALERDVIGLEKYLSGLMIGLPNLPLDTVPDGWDETENKVIRQSGAVKTFQFTPRPHWELGEELGVIDLERGAKLSGSRFFILLNQAARLERALINWMLDVHTREHGYVEVSPPVLVREEVLLSSGDLPKFRENLYRDTDDDLWLIPTAEVPLNGMHKDEILDQALLPINYVANTPCFRREKTAAGRDTRGIKRVHQFEKVEMYKIVQPDADIEGLALLVEHAEDLCERLGLAHRVVQLCAGDLSLKSAMTYDIEVWAPGCQEWLEVSSCSTCTDFQARRSNIRYRPKSGGRTEYVHTLNGSGLALPRIMIAIMETYQRQDGSIEIPQELQAYTGFATIE
jgi:seryl-tRNA synthetase